METIFINNVIQVMKNKGITVEELAGKCDVATEFIDRLFKQNISIKLNNAVMIADVLETTVDRLIGRVDC